MDEPPTNTVSCEVVDLGFGVFIARTPPPRKPLPKNLTPITPSNQTPPVTRLSPYVSIISTPNPPLTTSPSPNMPINDTLSNVRSKAASSLRACKPRQPLPQNDWNHSPLRPLVPADRRVLLWTTPHSLCAQASLDNEISPRLQEKVFTNLLQATSHNTRQSYGAGILRFTQFCDREEISENLRMPASATLLSAFIADAIGTCTGECIRNWLNGLRLWHLFNRAEWHGKDSWVRSLQKSADKAGVLFKRPLRNPITSLHLSSLRENLDITSPLGAAVWAAALTAFWGCRRLGELLISSSFSKDHDVTRNARVSTSFVNGKKVISFHLPWTKTTGIAGGDCILTATNNLYCPVWALENHLKINEFADPNIPLFAFRSKDTWHSLKKDLFLHTTTGMKLIL